MDATPAQAETSATAPGGGRSGHVVALVPLRTGGKSRLAHDLTPGQREQLVRAMFDDVVAALTDAGVADVRVLAGSPAAVDAAHARGLAVIADPHGPSAGVTGGDQRLRVAVDAALARIPVDTVRLVVAADLPCLAADEVRRILADPSAVVVAPTNGGGTAVLRLAHGVTLPARYGRGSASAHVDAARTADHPVSVLDLAGCRHDVDATADLEALRGPQGAGTTGRATASFLARPRG